MSGLPVIDGGSPLRIGHIPPTTFGGCETQPFFAQKDAQKIGIQTVLADYPKCGRGDKHGLIDPQRAPPTADYIVLLRAVLFHVRLKELGFAQDLNGMPFISAKLRR